MPNSVVVAILSGDHRLTGKVADKIKSQFLGEDGAIVIPSTVDEAREELTYPPILGGSKIIQVGESVFSDEFCKMLVEVCHAVPENCMAVCRVYELDGSCATILKKMPEGRLKILKYGVLNGFNDAVEFVLSRATDQGGRIEKSAARDLVSIVGHDDASMLISEVDKLLVVSHNDITCDAVAKYAFEMNSFKFYKLYNALAAGDFEGAIVEMKQHIDSVGCEGLDMSVSKLLSVCCRLMNSFSGVLKEVHVADSTRHWWPDGVDKLNSMPSKFMIDCATKIVDRIGDGVQSLMKEAVSDMPLHRVARLPYPEERLYMKAAAICLGGRNNGFDVLHWDRSVFDGDGAMRD